MKKFTKRDLAREVVAKNLSADTKTLARLLCKRFPEVFYDIEQARTQVRKIRGASGKRCRTKSQATHPRTELPEPDTSGWKNHELPSDIKRWLIISDLHIPYYSRKALELSLDFGKDCDGILILGDLLDFYQLSRFEKDPRNRNAGGEIQMAKRVLGQIQERNKPKKMRYKGGNHDARLPSYFMQRCPEMFDVLDVHCSMDKILGLDQMDIPYIHDKHTLSHEDLTLVHGHEWGSGVFNPVNPARGAFIRAHDNVIQGHSHRTSDHTETTLRDVAISCWSIGCLSELHPLYRPIANRWNHGFAILNAGKNWSIENKRIISEKKVT